MKNIDKLHAIKDFLNRALRAVYDITDNGLITDMFYKYSQEKFDWQKQEIKLLHQNELLDKILRFLRLRPKSKYSIAIVYTKQLFTIEYWLNTDRIPIIRVFHKLVGEGAHSSLYKGMKIRLIYERLLPYFDYSDEELKLYFKLTS